MCYSFFVFGEDANNGQQRLLVITLAGGKSINATWLELERRRWLAGTPTTDRSD